ncbi:NAD(P)H-dependent flavin oxidoreductase [Dongia deserti]|uniref:NAD(P)H-dependent flavin oxidoreductase n=1 Tax=Dongia deserti TaxID=2268030 RepID=UPI000E64B419|nr:nitronate monooxygenase [Dongia deserti]
MSERQSPRERAQAFCQRFGLRLPILLAPMAGACPPSLSIAVANAGGLGGCGATLMQPAEIECWVSAVRAKTNGGFQINLWVPDPPPQRDPAAEQAMRDFLAAWGPPVQTDAAEFTLPDFAAQCDAILAASPSAISSIMGLYPAAFVARMKAQDIAWFATVTTVAEAKRAVEAGADVIVAQGMEAGGHRGSFDASYAEPTMAGLFALLPAIVDAVPVPVVATGGIADERGVAACLVLGASAVQIGTGFLRAPEAGIPTAWADAIADALPEHTLVTRAFSGRAGRSYATAFARAANAPGAPRPTPYPIQRGLTQGMRSAAAKTNTLDGMQAWSGQGGWLAQARPASEIAQDLWRGAQALLP